ncbi:MAG TPA: 6-phosphogluconolactonase [Solimonas sp.]|nr:6-phosphogluconolactonase [Solimonas sp.]
MPLRLPAAIGQQLFDHAAAAAQALADDVATRLIAAIAARGTASLVVPGGTTPLLFLAALSTRPLDWARVRVCPSDERWVDPAAPESNEGLLRRHLLRDAAADAVLVSLKTSAAVPEWAIEECSARLALLPRPLDVVVLGMGTDGHVASLFPDAPEIDAALDLSQAAAVMAMRPPSSALPRMSLSLRSLLDSRQLAILISGAEKRTVLELAAARPADRRCPVSLLLHQQRVPLSVFHSQG